MKLLVVSDTHGEADLLKELAIKYKDYTKIHLGDRGFDKALLDELNFIHVDGNCDYGNDKDKIIEIEGNIILLTHGDKYQVKYDLGNLYFKALEVNANIVLYGHTHIQSKIEYNGILFLNPGALKDNKYLVIDDNIKFY